MATMARGALFVPKSRVRGEALFCLWANAAAIPRRPVRKDDKKRMPTDTDLIVDATRNEKWKRIDHERLLIDRIEPDFERLSELNPVPTLNPGSVHARTLVACRCVVQVLVQRNPTYV